MIALLIIGLVVVAAGTYWLGVNHGREHQSKKLTPWVEFADPALQALSFGGATVVHVTARRVGDDFTATYLPLTEDE